jgi:hypothetical protein
VSSSRDATETTGACFDSLPIGTGDLSGLRNSNAVGIKRHQIVDFRVNPAAKKVSVVMATVQNDQGAFANLFRPANDAKFVFEMLPDKLQLKISADAFPAVEGFWIPPTGPTPQAAFNTNSFFGTDPSPLALLGSGFLANVLLNAPARIFGNCLAPDVPNKTTCVPSSYEATVNFSNV